MIRIGRYDAFEKWAIVCRVWAGEKIDAGQDRLNRPCVPHWCSEAFWAGRWYCDKLLSLKRGALAEENEMARLVREIGYTAFHDRVIKLIDSIQLVGFDSATVDLPLPIARHLKEAFKFGALIELRYTEDVGEIPDIEILRAKRRPFPRHTIRGKRSVLDMFCARQYGILDAIHVYDACPDSVTLVDLDPVCLDVMKQIYPPEWNYVCADYREFLRDAEARGLVYDLVIADPWEGMCEEVGFDMFPAIADRCTDMIVLHYLQRMFDALGAGPDDFDGLSRAIKQRTGVDIAVVDWIRRSFDNGYVAMRKG